MIGRLISINPSKAQSIDLMNNTSPIIIGRIPTSTIRLEDNRCSSNHCKISIEQVGNEWNFIVEDLSTNGTFLNGLKVMYKQIGKGNKASAKWGSTLDILKAPLVENDSKIGFIFEEIKVEKRKIDDSAPEKKLKVNEGAGNFDMDEMAENLKCQICMEIMFQPVSLYPCLHSFCGGCFSD